LSGFLVRFFWLAFLPISSDLKAIFLAFFHQRWTILSTATGSNGLFLFFALLRSAFFGLLRLRSAQVFFTPLA